MISDEFYQMFKRELISNLLTDFQNIKEKETLPNSYTRPVLPWYQSQKSTLLRKLQTNSPDKCQQKNVEPSVSQQNSAAH